MVQTTEKNTIMEKLIAGETFLKENKQGCGEKIFPFYSSLEIITGCEKMLVINTILMFRGGNK